MDSASVRLQPVINVVFHNFFDGSLENLLHRKDILAVANRRTVPSNSTSKAMLRTRLPHKIFSITLFSQQLVKSTSDSA